MRVKVESGPPLPSLKAWFIVSPVATIYDLKATLCAELPALREGRVAAKDISLSLDGFELLDDSHVEVVRDGDLLTIKQTFALSNKHEPSSRKRARHSTERPHSIVAKSSPQPLPVKSGPDTQTSQQLLGADTSSSESSFDSSESDSDSTTSESDTESDSSSDSSSSASSEPSVERSTLKSRTAAAAPLLVKPPPKSVKADERESTKAAPASSNVPPGQGKPGTQSRNLRRRRKKQYEREPSQGDPHGVNDIPLGLRAATARSEPVASPQAPAPPTIMMASLSNKNKRKGFKQSMSAPLPKKIIFEGGEVPDTEAVLPFTSAPNAEVTATAPNLFPRLIPPSEKQENGQLPPNLFVTSIDVEEGMHPPRRKKNKQRPDPHVGEAQEVDRVILDYGESGDTISTQREQFNEYTAALAIQYAKGSLAPDLDWSFIDGNWETMPKVTSTSLLQRGILLGWKALAINPATFTPEFLLNVGRVTESGAKLTVQPLLRPGAVEVSFGSRLEEEEDGVGELEEEAFEWNDVFAGDWRII
ncbi:hypothetical protein EW026_g3616 [Hermanssonia centrifuga]|uniref:Coilin n=1 Tax=Hermanssonia centrifuga TaxID=98765 RepID=A0A4S4KJM3_9APHY|nr:hypothetical protein EW026_g3616 [Hermanssonia centrifuga]